LVHSSQYLFAYAADANGSFVSGVPIDVVVDCSQKTYTP
jgi:hypothetical protein